jgi:hypothetical protein
MMTSQPLLRLCKTAHPFEYTPVKLDFQMPDLKAHLRID